MAKDWIIQSSKHRERNLMKASKITPAMLTLGAAVALGATAMAVSGTARAACSGKMQSSCSGKSQNGMKNTANGSKCSGKMTKCGSKGKN